MNFPTQTKAKERLLVRFGIDVERSFNSWMEELGVYSCKIEGCERKALQHKGPYALLCEEHAADKKANRQPRDYNRPKLEVVSTPNGEINFSRLSEKVKKLPKIVVALEKSSKAHRKTKGDLAQALREFNTTLRDIQTTAANLIREE